MASVLKWPWAPLRLTLVAKRRLQRRSGGGLVLVKARRGGAWDVKRVEGDLSTAVGASEAAVEENRGGMAERDHEATSRFGGGGASL
jgi:hypothetical protein